MLAVICHTTTSKLLAVPARIEAAARAAEAYEFIAALPDGYAHAVGEGGAELSGVSISASRWRARSIAIR